MSLIRFENVHKRYPGKVVLDGVCFQIHAGEHIAMVGRNGCGKTTILQLIAGRLEPDSGVIERQRGIRISYLEQLPTYPPEATVLSIAEGAHEELKHIEQRLRELEEQISIGKTDLVSEYAQLEAKFYYLDGFSYPAKVKKVLAGLGFTSEYYSRTFSQLSGGEQTRLMLAVALLQEADILLLDEPDNYLDIEGKEWLEEYLINSPRTVVIISHDQRLLTRFPQRILELERGQITSYVGAYPEYKATKALRYQQAKQQYEAQVKELQRQMEWIEKFRYKNTRASSVQSRLKQIRKQYTVDKPVVYDPQISFEFQSNSTSGYLVLVAENLSMQYGEKVLYRDLSFQLYRGDRIGIIGPNGSGKSTLIQHILRRIHGGGGSIRYGHNIKIAYYDQHRRDLDPENEVLQEVQTVRPDWLAQSLRTYLGAFLFQGDDVFRKVKTLSGGEQSRLAIAKLILQQPNLLILDEPTNHMDLASREALEDALTAYEGTLILVTHDRELLDTVVERLIVLKDGKAEIVWGNYSHYKWKQKTEIQSEKFIEEKISKKQERNEFQQAKLAKKEVRKKERKRAEIESEIEQLEKEIQEIELSFSFVDPKNYLHLSELTRKLEEKKNRVNELYIQWEELCD